jgi:hypothetical protein
MVFLWLFIQVLSVRTLLGIEKVGDIEHRDAHTHSIEKHVVAGTSRLYSGFALRG